MSAAPLGKPRSHALFRPLVHRYGRRPGPASRPRRCSPLKPLSFGQLSVLRSIEHIPRPLWSVANIAYWLPLKPSVTVEEARAALELLAERHESLRTVYALPKDAAPRQRVEDRAHGVIEQAEIEDTREARDALVESSRERTFTLEDDFGWRATIATADGRPRGIAMCLHHIAADDWAQGVLEDGLAGLLAEPRPAPPSGTGDTVDSPTALALEQRSTAWRTRRQQARRFHGDVLRSGLLSPLPLSAEDGLREPPPRYDGELPLDHLGGAVAARARSAQVLPQALFLAASTLTAAVCFGELSTAWWMMASNRFDPRWGALVTSMNQIVPMRADLPADATVTELAQRLQQDSFAALRYGCYDVDEINNLSHEIIGGLPEWRYMFNYSVNGALPDRRDEGPLDAVPHAEPRTRTSHRSSPALCYFVVADDPVLTLQYYTTRAQADERQVAGLLRTYETVLRQILLHPDRPVSRLLEDVRSQQAGTPAP
ncbi:condensation domain-containing protein [Streptomyces sp. NPDC032940]|uniref:condensation domain-containing protein n=1 Tax=Streptomyces sp. NPDC032940 TaxID=3155366 RepID=UPI003408D43B